METVKPLKGAKAVRIDCADGWYEYMSMEEMLSPRILLTLDMEGKPLLNRHGAPLRLIDPSKYGYKSAKLITSIEFVDGRKGKHGLRSGALLQPQRRDFAGIRPSAGPWRKGSEKDQRRRDYGVLEGVRGVGVKSYKICWFGEGYGSCGRMLSLGKDYCDEIYGLASQISAAVRFQPTSLKGTARHWELQHLSLQWFVVELELASR